MKRLGKGFLLSLAVLAIISVPVLAGVAYQAVLPVIEEDGNAYSMLPFSTEVDNEWLADNGFLAATGLDTRVQTLSGLLKPHMVVDDKTLSSVPVPANSQTNLYYTTGNSALTAMDILTGYKGRITILDDADLELDDGFTLDFEGAYLDTTVGGGNRELLTKASAITVSIPAIGTVNVAMPGEDVYNSDSHIEVDSVDGYIEYVNGAGVIWATIHDAVNGTNHDDAGADLYIELSCDANVDKFDVFYRSILLFDTSPIPDGATIFSTTLSIKGSGKADDKPWGDSEINVFSSNPASDNDLVIADYNQQGIIPFATAIAYGDYNAADWNTFNFNVAGIAAVDDVDITYLSVRESVYDAPNIPLVWDNGSDLTYIFKSADSAGNEPYLTVVYTALEVEAVNVTTGVHDIEIGADGVNAWISVDNAVAGDYYDITALGGVSVPDTATDYVVMNNATNQFFPYMDLFRVTTDIGGSSVKGLYAPVTMVENTTFSGTADAGGDTDTLIDAALTQANNYWDWALVTINTAGGVAPEGETGVCELFEAATDEVTLETALTDTIDAGDTYTIEFGTLVDRQGASEDGIITWGVNPDGVSASLGSMVSEGQPVPGVDISGGARDVLPVTEITDWYVEPDVAGTLLTNPLRPFVTLLSDNSSITEIQSWRLYASALILLITVGSAITVKGHQGITSLMAGASILGAVVLTIFPQYILVIAIFLLISGLVFEIRDAF